VSLVRSLNGTRVYENVQAFAGEISDVVSGSKIALGAFGLVLAGGMLVTNKKRKFSDYIAPGLIGAGSAGLMIL
jgi:hypothetical protein